MRWLDKKDDSLKVIALYQIIVQNIERGCSEILVICSQSVCGVTVSNPVVPTHYLNVKPKLLESRPVAQTVIERIYTFVDAFIHGLAG